MSSTSAGSYSIVVIEAVEPITVTATSPSVIPDDSIIDPTSPVILMISENPFVLNVNVCP